MVRIVHNRLLGGWYVVRGPHQWPLSGRFDSREAARAWLDRDRGGNPIAAALRSPHLRAQRIPSARLYSRKGRGQEG